MAGAEDRRDRREAMRLFVAVAIACLLLMVMGFLGVYYFTEYFAEHDPFGTGLGLKEAAVVSFGVSLVVILVMTIVAGDGALFGELPFTILGFLIFFVVFWLMIAWIF